MFTSETGGGESGESRQRRSQVADQCRAVAHLASVLASVHSDYEAMFRDADVTGPNQIVDAVGAHTAAFMETLGNMLNGMDAVDESDAWLDPIFKEAQRLWPASTEHSGGTVGDSPDSPRHKLGTLPVLTRNDLALALFGVQHMQRWWSEQPRSGYRADELRKSKALNEKLSGILDAMDPPQLYEDEISYIGDGDEPVYAPTDEARRLQAEAERQAQDWATPPAQPGDAIHGQPHAGTER